MTGNGLLNYAKWWPWALVAIGLHLAGIGYLLLEPSTSVPVMPEDAPMAVTLAREQQSTVIPKTDLAINKAATNPSAQPAAPETAVPVSSPVPAVAVPVTNHGTLNIHKQEKQETPAKPVEEQHKHLRKRVITKRKIHEEKHQNHVTPAQEATSVPVTEHNNQTRQEAAAVVAGAAMNSVHQMTDWRSQILLRLQKVKNYPDSARAMQEEDTITVSFTVQPDGSVTNIRIVKSQGFEPLEDEVMNMLAKASPMPKPPAGEAVTLTVPVAFSLN